ncbi:MAG: T9SS type A sorting domain-containing protein [Lutibacter sp.]|nr:T9SS type A sorting domain-containing protein [Lutibacter sp.]MBP9601051.1 T9SS type A sorting domain-containing protein [Lutibacter sp.]
MKTKLLFIALLLNYCLANSQAALNFDGVNDFILGTNNSSLNISQGTIEAWIKTDNAGAGFRGIVVKQYKYGIFLYNNAIAVYDWSNGSKTETSLNLADDAWHHVAFSFDLGVLNGSKIYLDGMLVSTLTYNSSTSNSRIVIGAGADYTLSQNFKGTIDQVRVWNTIRTNTEILTNYNKCLQGNESGLIMLWQFEEGTGTVVNDLSGNNNNGTLTNMDAATDSVAGYNCTPKNLVADYPFNGNANDESGNGNHGTVNGATLTTDRFGNVDSAYEFDGNDIITIAHNDILNSENELSISVWVKPTTLIDAMVLGKSNYTSKTNYLLRTKSTGYLQFEYKDFANTNSSPLNVNQWNHIVVVSETDNTKKVYINNVLTSHTSASSPYGLITNALTIGARPGAEFFNGSIDDLKIYKSALTTAEVFSLYTKNTLNIDKIENTAESNFYVSNNILLFKNTKNLNEIKTIEVYNLLGQKVFETSKIRKEISLEQLQQSIYILKVETLNAIQTLKIVIN